MYHNIQFDILNLSHWNLFVYWNLSFGIYRIFRFNTAQFRAIGYYGNLHFKYLKPAFILFSACSWAATEKSACSGWMEKILKTGLQKICAVQAWKNVRNLSPHPAGRVAASAAPSGILDNRQRSSLRTSTIFSPNPSHCQKWRSKITESEDNSLPAPTDPWPAIKIDEIESRAMQRQQ